MIVIPTFPNISIVTIARNKSHYPVASVNPPMLSIQSYPNDLFRLSEVPLLGEQSNPQTKRYLHEKRKISIRIDGFKPPLTKLLVKNSVTQWHSKYSRLTADHTFNHLQFRTTLPQVQILSPRTSHKNNPNNLLLGELFGLSILFEYPNFSSMKGRTPIPQIYALVSVCLLDTRSFT